MRCKKHYTDLSSIVGVCASCLRERLFSIIVAQEQALAEARAQALDDKYRNSDTSPAFPRSVSPYINCRHTDSSTTSTAAAAAAAWSQTSYHNHHHHHHHHRSLPDQRFFSTPQVGPTTGGYEISGNSYHKKRQGLFRFSSFTNLFRSKNRSKADSNSNSDPRGSVSNYRESCGVGGANATLATTSPSWFSSIMSSGGRRKNQPFYLDESATTAGTVVMRKQQRRDRGMSPVRHSGGFGGGEDELCDGSSGYESSESRKQTPRRTPAHASVRRGGGGGHGRNVSGLAFCLSPLVRASPNRRMPTDGGFSGEIRAPVKPHLSNVKSFCANRSRKLADFGRFNPNR